MNREKLIAFFAWAILVSGSYIFIGVLGIGLHVAQRFIIPDMPEVMVWKLLAILFFLSGPQSSFMVINCFRNDTAAGKA